MIKIRASNSPGKSKNLNLLFQSKLHFQNNSGFRSFNHHGSKSPHFISRKDNSPQSKRIKQVYQVYVSKHNLSPLRLGNLTPTLPSIQNRSSSKCNRLTSDEFKKVLNKYRNISQVVEKDDMKIKEI